MILWLYYAMSSILEEQKEKLIKMPLNYLKLSAYQSINFEIIVITTLLLGLKTVLTLNKGKKKGLDEYTSCKVHGIFLLLTFNRTKESFSFIHIYSTIWVYVIWLPWAWIWGMRVLLYKRVNGKLQINSLRVENLIFNVLTPSYSAINAKCHSLNNV